MVIKLPIQNITITLQSPGQVLGGQVTSDLHNPFGDPYDKEAEPEVTNELLYMAIDNSTYKGAVDSLYTMLLNHAAAGIDMTSPEYLKGIQAVVDMILKIGETEATPYEKLLAYAKQDYEAHIGKTIKVTFAELSDGSDLRSELFPNGLLVEVKSGLVEQTDLDFDEKGILFTYWPADPLPGQWLPEGMHIAWIDGPTYYQECLDDGTCKIGCRRTWKVQE